MNHQINHMNVAEDYLAKTSQRDLASGVLKQAAQDLRRFHGRTSPVERETVPLQEAASAYAKMMAGKARFRIVLVMNNGASEGVSPVTDSKANESNSRRKI